MKRVVLISILLVLICSSALIGYDWITSQIRLSPPAQNDSVITVDKSWVETVNNLLVILMITRNQYEINLTSQPLTKKFTPCLKKGTT